VLAPFVNLPLPFYFVVTCVLGNTLSKKAPDAAKLAAIKKKKKPTAVVSKKAKPKEKSASSGGKQGAYRVVLCRIVSYYHLDPS
jgi:hypothetical protein